jgi:hypothetical protein
MAGYKKLYAAVFGVFCQKWLRIGLYILQFEYPTDYMYFVKSCPIQDYLPFSSHLIQIPNYLSAQFYITPS